MGTITNIDRHSFGRKNSRKVNFMETKQWLRSINGLLTRLNTDVNNHLKLSNPWERKAANMVKSWKNILRAQAVAYPKAVHSSDLTWETAAQRMRSRLFNRQYQRERRTGWTRWAADRSQSPRIWDARRRESHADAGRPVVGYQSRTMAV